MAERSAALHLTVLDVTNIVKSQCPRLDRIQCPLMITDAHVIDSALSRFVEKAKIENTNVEQEKDMSFVGK